MRYRQFTGTLGELNKRIQEAEHRHYQVTSTEPWPSSSVRTIRSCWPTRELRLIEKRSTPSTPSLQWP